ncbi:GTP cyclohydrolase I FolE [Hyunsoonleella aestuarii]|uniref:GTP cyclohydrolase 1 n=2 Tax=Hyunsoonleella aestuarii TaxID=912802 RepID=A0ABP8EBM9_9FLAO
MLQSCHENIDGEFTIFCCDLQLRNLFIGKSTFNFIFIQKEEIKYVMPYKNLEEYNIEVTKDIKERYKNIIEDLGEDTSRDGLIKTPERAAKAMQFLTQGYDQDPVEILTGAMFKESYNEMVIVKDIELYSLCEHHILPFFGKVHIAYIPNGYIVGLSKLPRIVDVFARRLQVQERLTEQILDCINNTLKPQGVAVVIEASHMCMMMRGVQKQNSITTTSGFRGQFEKIETRNEFLKLIGK